MVAAGATDRVNNLRERVIRESETHTMPLVRTDYGRDDRYGWDDRQLLAFYKAWEKFYFAPTLVLRRSMAEAEMLRNVPIIIHEDDLICGQPDTRPLNQKEKREFEAFRRKHLDIAPQIFGRTGHMALDFSKLLSVGIEGILQEIEIARSMLSQDNMEEYTNKIEYYDCCSMQLEALLVLEIRYAEAARQNGWSEMAELIERVPRYHARTFHEALQSMHFYSFLLRDLFSCGRPDQLLIDYYRRDMRAGILTEKNALEILDCFNLQYTLYTRKLASIGYMIGGHAPSGEPVENELTWLFLMSIEHVRMPYPSVGLAVSKDTTEKLLDYALELLSEGLTHPALFNDDAITKALCNIGMSVDHAREYVHSTCVEITPCGRSGLWATSPYHNCAQILLDVLESRQDYRNIEELIESYKNELFRRIRDGQLEQNLFQLERSRNGGESWLASCLVKDCIQRGKSIDQGGAIYNLVLPDFIGVTNVIDSLASIDTLVFKEKRLTLEKYWIVLKDNYEKDEVLRQYIINRCPHFGNNDDWVDALAKRIYRMLVDGCVGLKTFRGEKVVPGAFSFIMHDELGKKTMATPDGRKSGEALNAGSDPVSGRDVSGPTASLLSTTEWDHLPFIGGVAVNIRLNMSDFTPERKINLRALVKTFMKRNGFELQINSVSAEELEDAIVNPEAHKNLLVRIGGFSDFFVNQTPEMQREIVSRVYHQL